MISFALTTILVESTTMKKITFALSFIILAVIACNRSAGTPAVVPDLVTSLPTQDVTPLPATPTVASAPTQIIQTITFTPLPPLQPVQQNVIRFKSGGTWLDVPGSLNSGASKTYTLNAMQGQIMSVSVLPESKPGIWGYFPIEITGRDGTILCPVVQNTECDFWRGALPSSQEYLITVKSGGDLTDYTLRVAINPPGKAEQIFQYNDSVTGLALTYSDQFAPARPSATANFKTDPEFALQFIDTNSYLNTNLGEAYFLLSSTFDPQKVATCTDPNPNGAGPEVSEGNVVINGYHFVRSSDSGVGAGNIYEQNIYRTVNQNVCYEVIFFIHSSNIGNYTPGTVKEFDMNGLLRKFNGILSTFRVK